MQSHSNQVPNTTQTCKDQHLVISNKLHASSSLHTLNFSIKKDVKHIFNESWCVEVIICTWRTLTVSYNYTNFTQQHCNGNLEIWLLFGLLYIVGSNLKPYVSTHPHIKHHHARHVDLQVLFRLIEESHFAIQMLDNSHTHCVRWVALWTLMHTLDVNRCRQV